MRDRQADLVRGGRASAKQLDKGGAGHQAEDESQSQETEIWGGMRLAQMQAFVVNGEVRYSCLWNEGTYGQVWRWMSEDYFKAKTGELWGSMRLAQMQAFEV